MGVTTKKLAAALALAAAVAATATAALPTTTGSTGTTPGGSGGRTCACGGPPTLDASYASASLVVRATPINSYMHDGSVYYTLTAVTHLKGCAAISAMPTAVTAHGAGSCGVSLQLDVPTLLFLRDGMELSRCDAHRPWASLSAADAKALTAKRVCGQGCRPGEAPAACAVDPCADAAPPCAAAVKCVADTCGGCWARWFNKEGEAAECNTAPSLALDDLEEAESVGHAKVVGA